MKGGSTTDIIDRLIKPVYGLISDADTKALWSFFVSGIYVLLDVFGRMFEADWFLIASIIVLMGFDYLTGVFNAYLRRKNVRSIGFRGTLIKFIEYSIAILTAIVLSNMHEMLDWVQVWVAVFIAGTEAKSIWENVFIEGRVNLLTAFVKELRNRTGVNVDPNHTDDEPSADKHPTKKGTSSEEMASKYPDYNER